MQEVPLDIAQRIWNAGLVKLYPDWINTVERIGWDELSGESPVSHAIEWANSVRMDTRYLTSSLSMWFYRCGTQLCLEWAPDDDCPPGGWETPTGKEQVESRKFEVACHDFAARLLRDMGERIGQVESGVTWSGVSFIAEQLLAEHDARSRWMEDAFLRVKKAAPVWDWGRIEHALHLASGGSAT